MRISARGALVAAALAAVAAGAFAQPTLYGISYAAEFLAGVLANPGNLILNLGGAAGRVAERQLGLCA